MNKKAAKEKADERRSVNMREPQSWRSQEIGWFIPFWNEQRRKYQARLPALLWLTAEQERALKFRQADYGVEVVRQMVLNAMQSDYLNCRTGKQARNDLDFLLSEKFFPRVAQGRYNDLEPEERPKTAEELRRESAEAYRAQQEARRAEARRIEEEERERQRARRQREYEEWLRQRPSPAELKKILGDNYLLDK